MLFSVLQPQSSCACSNSHELIIPVHIIFVVQSINQIIKITLLKGLIRSLQTSNDIGTDKPHQNHPPPHTIKTFLPLQSHLYVYFRLNNPHRSRLTLTEFSAYIKHIQEYETKQKDSPLLVNNSKLNLR